MCRKKLSSSCKYVIDSLGTAEYTVHVIQCLILEVLDLITSTIIYIFRTPWILDFERSLSSIEHCYVNGEEEQCLKCSAEVTGVEDLSLQ